MACDEDSADALLNAADRLEESDSEACETLATDMLLYVTERLDAISAGVSVKVVLTGEKEVTVAI